MTSELSPRDIVGVEVIVQPMTLAKMTGIFFPTTLELREELAEIIGLDFVQMFMNVKDREMGQRKPSSLHIFYGVHVDLLQYQGRRENHHYFKGNFFCTEKRMLYADDPQARPYLEKKHQNFFFPEDFSRN